MEKSKFFWKLGENTKKIYSIDYNSNLDYYSFLQKQFDAGYRQVIISSEAMIALVKEIAQKENINVYKIELVEDDDDLNNEIEKLIHMYVEHKIKLDILTDRLYFLAEDSSIEIKRIFFNGRIESGVAIDIFVQSNGIIGYRAENNCLMLEIKEFLQKFMFG